MWNAVHGIITPWQCKTRSRFNFDNGAYVRLMCIKLDKKGVTVTALCLYWLKTATEKIKIDDEAEHVMCAKFLGWNGQ